MLSFVRLFMKDTWLIRSLWEIWGKFLYKKGKTSFSQYFQTSVEICVLAHRAHNLGQVKSNTVQSVCSMVRSRPLLCRWMNPVLSKRKKNPFGITSLWNGEMRGVYYDHDLMPFWSSGQSKSWNCFSVPTVSQAQKSKYFQLETPTEWINIFLFAYSFELYSLYAPLPSHSTPPFLTHSFLVARQLANSFRPGLESQVLCCGTWVSQSERGVGPGGGGWAKKEPAAVLEHMENDTSLLLTRTEVSVSGNCVIFRKEKL